MTGRQGARQRRAIDFSDEESFGLFMEAVRELQLYEDESTKTDSDVDMLRSHLEEALDVLDRCVRDHPDDALPAYYLGIAKTIQGQRMYVKRLRDRSDRPTTPLPMAHSSATGTVLTSTGGHAERFPGIGPLEHAPSPLLDRALDCFMREDVRSVAGLSDAALFNAANVHSHLGRDTNYAAAIGILDVLRPIDKETADVVGTPPAQSWTGWLRSRLRPTAFEETDDALAFHLSVDILRTAAKGMLAVLTANHTRSELVESSIRHLTALHDKAANAIGRDSVARHDVLADVLTRRGMLRYFAATATTPFDEPLLKLAERDLLNALEHKHNWIPPQIYLVQVYQGLGLMTKADELIMLVLGKPRTPETHTVSPGFSGPSKGEASAQP